MLARVADGPERGRHAGSARDRHRPASIAPSVVAGTVRADLVDRAADVPVTAPGTEALLARLARRDPPTAVVIVGAGVPLPPGRDPRGVIGLAVLELPAGVDPELVGWDAVSGLDVVIVVDDLPVDPERLSGALRAAGARRGTVTTLTGRGPAAGRCA